MYLKWLLNTLAGFSLVQTKRTIEANFPFTAVLIPYSLKVHIEADVCDSGHLNLPQVHARDGSSIT